MAVKTDMSKAYDRLEWEFIENVLRRIGFHRRFIGWIMECIRTVTYSVIINGTPKGRIVPQRGIRQGDPLSPYIFILCSEVLSGLCNRAAEEGRLQGIRVAQGSPRIHHLLFADDTMFFCKANSRNVEALKDILGKYEQASGQAINKQKSSITFSRKTVVGVKIKVKNDLQLRNEGGVGKYLGLPEHFGRKKRDLFEGIIDRIRQKTLNWSNRFLSTAGKMTLLKSVLSAIPTYAMSCFKLPNSLCNKIQSCLTRFWWDKNQNEKKMAWTAWSTLTKRKREGGLGFREIKAFNSAMLGKLSWRILQNPQSLLARILLGKYCQHQDFMTCQTAGTASHGWRSILLGRDALKGNVGWAIGDGESTRIWEDNWLAPDHQEAPLGPTLESLYGQKVSTLIDPSTKTWDRSKIREILPHYEQKILSIKLSTRGAKDKIIWLNHYTGEYSVKSGYHSEIKVKATTQEGENRNWNWHQNVWNTQTNPKIKLFLWKAAVGALPTKERLLTRKIIEDPACSKCGQPESIAHILFFCSYAKEVWEQVPVTRKVEFHEPMDFKTGWNRIRSQMCLPPTGLNIPIAPWVCWNLWKARNNREFNNRIFTSEETVRKSLLEAKEWKLAQEIEKKTATYQRPNTISTDPEIVQCRSDGA